MFAGQIMHPFFGYVHDILFLLYWKILSHAVGRPEWDFSVASLVDLRL
jgi:hypothetical protein